jgi:hypothetical protein
LNYEASAVSASQAGRRQGHLPGSPNAMPVAMCIVGDSRSGSTLLQGLLALHPDITAVGEIARLEYFIETNRACSCGKPVARCGYWSEVIEGAGIPAERLITYRPRNRLHQRFEEAAGILSLALGTTSFGRAVLPHGRHVADDVGRLLLSAAGVSNAKAVVDGSKEPGHLVYLAHQQHIRVYPIFCIRDGRATVHSKMKRGEISVELATKHWRNVIHAMIWLRRLIGSKHSDWVVYEEMCLVPAKTVDRVVANAGLPQAPLASLSSKGSHYIGGTPGFSMDRIESDQSWREEMSPSDLAIFDRMAGKLNRSLGYVE